MRASQQLCVIRGGCAGALRSSTCREDHCNRVEESRDGAKLLLEQTADCCKFSARRKRTIEYL